MNHRPQTTATASFDALGLSQATRAAITDLGYETPSPVQAAAIPQVLSGRDVMAAAQTGTGKRAAFLLPTLDRLGHARHGQGPLMLVVTPTRELAQQIDAAAAIVCRHTGHSRCVLVGGVSYDPQRAALRRGCDVLVATPGRLIDLIDQGDASLSQVEVLVLDEADRMLDMGFLPSMRTIVARCPHERQTLLFSATLSDDVLAHTSSLVHDPARVEIAPKGTAAETVEQYVLPVSAQAKSRLLPALLKREGTERVIVFCRGKHRADGLCRRLRKEGISCAPIHGNRSQNQRERALRGFRAGEVDVLVATDVLARGIDIPDVSYVVNFDVPGDAEDYIHRIGRTGRAGETGWALTLVTEDDYLDLRDAEQLMGTAIPLFLRGEGLETGGPDRLSFFDANRNPAERLPGKRARKRMAEERERRRGGTQGEAARQTMPTRSHGRVSDGRRQPQATASADDTKPGRGRTRTTDERPRRDGTTASRGRRGTAKGSAPRHANHGGAAYGPGARPQASKRPQSRRHPGDRGGGRR